MNMIRTAGGGWARNAMNDRQSPQNFSWNDQSNNGKSAYNDILQKMGALRNETAAGGGGMSQANMPAYEALKAQMGNLQRQDADRGYQQRQFQQQQQQARTRQAQQYNTNFQDALNRQQATANNFYQQAQGVPAWQHVLNSAPQQGGMNVPFQTAMLQQNMNNYSRYGGEAMGQYGYGGGASNGAYNPMYGTQPGSAGTAPLGRNDYQALAQQAARNRFRF